MSTLEIVSAWYGIELGGMGCDVTAVIKDFVASGKESISIINKEMQNDPVFNAVKTIWVTYSVDGGATTKTYSTGEYTELLLSDLA
jgi:hypothetical protein